MVQIKNPARKFGIMGTMHLYDIFEHPRYGLKAVKRGFSWSAFLAPTVWAAGKGLGRLTLILVVTSTLMFDLLDMSAGFISDPWTMGFLFLLSYMLFGLKPGLNGNDWHVTYLQHEGWRRRCQVVARSPRHAVQSVYAGRLHAPSSLYVANGAA